MLVGLGLIILMGFVFGLYVLHGGSLEVILKAAPIELGIILGAGLGATIIGNDVRTLKGLALGFKRVFTGSTVGSGDYLDAIFLVAGLMKTLQKKGARALENDIENPTSSQIFVAYPSVLRDAQLLSLITSTLRLLIISSNNAKWHDVEHVMETAIGAVHKERLRPVVALEKLASGLPALGIVACILGIVKTMASIDSPPSVLGALIASALVGTFLGVFLAYGLVEPLSIRLKRIVNQEMELFHVVQQIIVGTIAGHSQPLIIEAARASIEPSLQPSFEDVFDGLLK